MRRNLRLIAAAVAALLAGGGVQAADPGYYVVTPYDRAGQATLELRYWTWKRGGRPLMEWPEAAVGYGVNSRWTTTLLTSYIGSRQEAVEPSLTAWQNVVLLTQGEWPVDVALFGAWVRAESAPYHHAFEWGPMLQTDIGRTQLNLNFIFDRTSGAARPAPTQLKLQWQVKQRVARGWQLGVQGFDELGPWDHWAPHARQSHRVGPAGFGQIAGAGERVLEWQAALLSGRTYGRAGTMFSARIGYTF